MNDARRRPPQTPAWLQPLVSVPLILIAVLQIAPLAALAATGLTHETDYGSLLKSGGSVRIAFATTFRIAAAVTLMTALVSVPIVGLLLLGPRIVSRGVFAIAVCSLYLSVTVRSYAWILLLRESSWFGGLLARLLGGEILYTPTAVVIGMTHILLPYSILATWTALRHLPPASEQVAASLGASRLYYLARVVIPQASSGLFAGGVLVFLLSLGFYITPELLGGGRGETMMAGTLIDQQMNSLGRWSAGSAIAALLLAAVAVLALIALAVPAVRAVWQDLFAVRAPS